MRRESDLLLAQPTSAHLNGKCRTTFSHSSAQNQLVVDRFIDMNIEIKWNGHSLSPWASAARPIASGWCQQPMRSQAQLNRRWLRLRTAEETPLTAVHPILPRVATRFDRILPAET
jgi:hypothetical protein